MFIRTKDRIYEISKILKNGNLLIKGRFHINKEVADKYFKQSDNLAELCDAFVYVDTKHNIELYKYMIRKSLGDNDTKYMKMGTEIYGAIWTDKGLIFVAKMNDNRELVLI